MLTKKKKKHMHLEENLINYFEKEIHYINASRNIICS